MEHLPEILIAMVGGGGLAGVLSAIFSKRKHEVMAELQIVDSATGLIATLREELNRLQARVEHLENKTQQLESENDTLEKRITALHTENVALEFRCAELEKENTRLNKMLQGRR